MDLEEEKVTFYGVHIDFDAEFAMMATDSHATLDKWNPVLMERGMWDGHDALFPTAEDAEAFAKDFDAELRKADKGNKRKHYCSLSGEIVVLRSVAEEYGLVGPVHKA